MLLVGCGAKEEVVKETSPILVDRQIVFDAYGDAQTLDLNEDEALVAVSDDAAVLVPDKDDLNQVVKVNYIQGNSLNDWAVAYAGAKGYELQGNGFIDESSYYGFRHNESDNTWVMVTADSELQGYCEELLGRF